MLSDSIPYDYAPSRQDVLLLLLPDQLAPFRGIFGCDPERGWQTVSGKGTLFRLPLRTREAAGRSKIKDGRGGAPGEGRDSYFPPSPCDHCECC